MTNEQIIFNRRCRLLEDGKIKPTGNTVNVTDEHGDRITLAEPEPIHTYAVWRDDYGRKVKHGEHAVTKIRIWKHTVKKAEKETDPDEEKMIMVTSAFFTEEQTEPIKEKGDDMHV